MGKKTYTFVLNFGYAESGRLSFLPWTSQVTFSNAKEALIDLATFLKEEFLLKHRSEPHKCCTASKEKDPQADFCAKCGRSLAEEEFDPEGYMEWVTEIANCDVDSFHGDYIDWDESKRWQSNGLEGALTKGANTRFVYVAEKVLAAAIGHSPDDRVTIDSIFKDRTKSGGSSFSFW